jgi:CheY-like chemotaxis protein
MSASPRRLEGIRVLVVEDHADTRDLYEQALVHQGASVVTSESADEALTRVDDRDVVVTDYSMPGGTGRWLLDRILERPRPIPVIVVTGFADVYVTELAGPFARVLRKPVDPWHLGEVVQTVVRGR